MSQGLKFRELVAGGSIACLGAFDAMTARLIEASGARAAYVSGFAAAGSAFGFPDVGLISQTEMAEHVRRICGATSLPVIADADTGYGANLAVQRTVALWEAAGAAGLHIEDQCFPKRCGHVAGKSVIPVTEMVQKIKAALAARQDPQFFVIARTDAIAVTGLDDALERCKRYVDAGADAIFVDAPESEAHLRRIADALRGSDVPLVFNSARTGKSPFLSESRLRELGFAIVIYPIEGMLAASKAAKAVFEHIVAHGSTDDVVSGLTSFAEINALFGMDDAIAGEAAYVEAAIERKE